MHTGPDASRTLTEVFTTAEVARAAGAPESAVRRLVRAGEVATVGRGLLAGREALRAARRLRSGAPGAAPASYFGRALGVLSDAAAADRESRRVSAACSAVGHALVLAVVLGSFGMRAPLAEPAETPGPALSRLVFLSQPGPGGGGGGGGLRQPLPAPRAEREGESRVDSPVPPPEPPPRPAPPPPLEAEPLPRIAAPLVALAAGDRDVFGRLDALRRPDPARPGDFGGAGGGAGAGAGAGTGAGVGPGTGGGAGGGPYRPGSGVSPPRVLREVKPDYTEAARRAAVEGDVLLEVVVLADGAVGEVRLVRGLGFGLDERAVEAMRRWRFLPAERLGAPVAVLVEVAMAFRLL